MVLITMVPTDELLLQFSNICKLKEPDEIELMSLMYWTLTRITDEAMPLMKPPEDHVYRSYDLDDYVMIQKPNPEKDVIPPVVLRWYSHVYKWITRKDLDVLDRRGLVRISVHLMVAQVVGSYEFQLANSV